MKTAVSSSVRNMTHLCRLQPMGSLLNGYGSSSFAARGAADFLPRAESSFKLPGASEAHVNARPWTSTHESRVCTLSVSHVMVYLPRSLATSKGSLQVAGSLPEKRARRVYMWATAARLMHKV